MKLFHFRTFMMLVLLGLASTLVLAQDASVRQEPVSDFAPPTEALIACPTEQTETTICDVIATQPEDIVGVWSLYFQSQPAFIRFNLDGTWVLGNSVESTSDLNSASASVPTALTSQACSQRFSLMLRSMSCRRSVNRVVICCG